MTTDIIQNTNQQPASQTDAAQNNASNAVVTPENNVNVHKGNSHHFSATSATDDDKQNHNSNANEWYLSEGVKGQGEPPEWFDSKKYKTVADQAKGLPGFRKILGDFTGAPEDGYKVNLSEEVQKTGIDIDKESDLYKQFTELAKSSNLSQDGFDKIINLYLKNAAAQLPSKEERERIYQEEIKSIGGEEKLEELNQWGQNNLPEDMYAIFKEKVVTANDARLFMYIRDMMSRSSVPTGNKTPTITNDDLLKLHADPRMKTDVNFQKYVMGLYKTVYPK